MKPDKTYTTAQLENADRVMAFLASLPDGQRSMVVTVASAFIAGMEAQTRITAQERTAEKQRANHAAAQIAVQH